jgi:hypothetical protein
MPRLKAFLIEHGEIYTVRKYKMTEADVVIEGVGLCRRIPEGTIGVTGQLEFFVRLSGFDSVMDWWKMILKFIPSSGDTKYLYHVVRKEAQ